ncbi:MAG: phosphatidylserine decarboxylase family protein, partial [Gammaproteobacteria bacterium]|nr:phosphatidylserine decarboxylase family protein [Gammaproteobacteria bacterium]
MAVSRHPIIAKEGWGLILFVSLIIAAIHHFAGDYAAVLWLLPLLLLWFYRDPSRKLPSQPLGLVSPVNGIVELAEP